jgi:RNA polymerase sigma-70 factor (ECF subfamily)
MNRPPAGRVETGVGATTDEALLRELYDRHAAALFRYVLPLVGRDPQRAEDVVQETLLRAWRHPEALRSERGDVRPWLVTVARNLVVDAFRARRARPAEVGQEQLDDVPAPDELDRALDAWLVADALAALTPAHRAVVVEIFYRGRSVAEAAAVLHVPPGTVKSRTYYALRALRVALEERGVQA